MPACAVSARKLKSHKITIEENMSEAPTETKVPKVAKSVDDEIVALREKLRKLEEKQREARRKERERNTKAVLDMLKDEKMDQVAVAVWQKALPQLRKLLLPSGSDGADAS